jgi:hypothetical protein
MTEIKELQLIALVKFVELHSPSVAGEENKET